MTGVHDPKPCPVCYAPMRPTPAGFACDKHGVPAPAPPKPAPR